MTEKNLDPVSSALNSAIIFPSDENHKEEKVSADVITNLIEHPAQLQAPGQHFLPMCLTLSIYDFN